MKKKILIYCDDFYPNNTGYANAFLGFIEALLENTRDVYIEVHTQISLRDKPEVSKDNLKVVRLQNINIPKLGYMLKSIFNAICINKYFFKNKFDLLFIETFDNVLFLSFLSKKICKKTLVRVHSTSDTEYTFFKKSLSFNFRKLLLTNVVTKKINFYASTNNYHISFMKKYFFKSNQIDIGEKCFFLIPNTTNIKNENLLPNGGISGHIKLMMLGRMDDLGFNQKGFFDFLLAIKLLNETDLQKLDVTIVGNGKNIEIVRDFIKSYKNIRVIEYLTHKDCMTLMQSVDAVVLPSRYEGLSMFALESIALGKICLFSKVGGLVDLIDGNGILFDPQSFEQLSLGIKSLINLDQDEKLKMSLKSKSIYDNKFSSNTVADRFLFALNVISLLK